MDLYSRMVAFFKVLLPLAALAILATLFLISRGIDLDGTIPFAEREIAERLRSQQVTGPYFSGTTPGGDEITITATVARPGGNGAPAEADEVRARLTRAAGGEMTLDARTVSVDPSADLAVFTGDVLIETSTGLQVRTDQLETVLHGISGRTPGEVAATSPFGDLTAGAMGFGAKNGNGPIHVLFKGGVRLVYRPSKNTEN